MDASALLMVYSGLFVGVLLLIEGGYRMLVDLRFDPQRAVNRRLRMLATGANPEDVLRLLRRRDQRHEGLERFPPLRALHTLLRHSGATISLPRLLILMVLATGATYFSLRFVTVPTLTALGLALASGVLLPVGYLIVRRRRRIAQFGHQLPDALDLIVRSLRAGHPLSAALAVVAEEMPDPIGSEFGITVDETTYGLALPDAIENFAFRAGHPDLHYFLVAIRIQYGTGGNLAEVLAGLARVIRERFNMQKKIQAVSAEGRLSATILSAMPLVVAGLIMMIHPDFYLSVMNDTMFPIFLYVTLTLIVVNLVVMRQLVNFRF